MYYNPSYGVPVPPCAPPVYPMYQTPLTPINPYGMPQQMQQIQVEVDATVTPQNSVLTPPTTQTPYPQTPQQPYPNQHMTMQPMPTQLVPSQPVAPHGCCPQSLTHPCHHVVTPIPCYNQMPQLTPVFVEATIQPTVQPDKKAKESKDCDCQTTKTTYTKTTYMEAEVPLIQAIRAPYQMPRPAKLTCDNLPLATSYVTPQPYTNLNPVEDVLTQGTYFNDLYQPYPKGGHR